jgi:hypothetical protein
MSLCACVRCVGLRLRTVHFHMFFSSFSLQIVASKKVQRKERSQSFRGCQMAKRCGCYG